MIRGNHQRGERLPLNTSVCSVPAGFFPFACPKTGAKGWQAKNDSFFAAGSRWNSSATLRVIEKTTPSCIFFFRYIYFFSKPYCAGRLRTATPERVSVFAPGVCLIQQFPDLIYCRFASRSSSIFTVSEMNLSPSVLSAP